MLSMRPLLATLPPQRSWMHHFTLLGDFELFCLATLSCKAGLKLTAISHQGFVTNLHPPQLLWLLQAFGLKIDDHRNEVTVNGKSGSIEATGSAVKVLVIPTDEELCIAEQTLEVVEKL